MAMENIRYRQRAADLLLQDDDRLKELGEQGLLVTQLLVANGEGIDADAGREKVKAGIQGAQG
jgi:hypothetical protein